MIGIVKSQVPKSLQDWVQSKGLELYTNAAWSLSVINVKCEVGLVTTNRTFRENNAVDIFYFRMMTNFVWLYLN